MAASLEGPLTKLARGHRQFIVLKDEVEAVWSPRKTWPIRAEVDGSGLEYRFYLGELPAVDQEWGLLAGEIMFNLRSALDHLVWQLHVRHYAGRPIPEAVELASQFPIFDDWAKFRSRGQRRIKVLARRDQRAIRHLQPYIARNDKWQWVRPDLSALNNLHNVDKHRQLHLVTAAQAAAVIPRFAPDLGFRQAAVWGPVESHSHVETWTFALAPAKLEHHSGAILQVALEHRDGLSNLVPLMAELVDSVALVLARFATRFPPIQPPSTIAGLWRASLERAR